MNLEIDHSPAVESSKHEPAGPPPQRSNEWLAAVLAASRDGIVVEANAQIVEVNKACLHLLGYASPSELVGRPLALLCAAPDGKQLLALGDKRANDGSPEVFRFAARRKSRQEIQLEATIERAVLNGTSHRILVLRDLPTQTGSPPQPPVSLEPLTAHFTHDLKNLLTAIRCQTELVLLYQTVPPTAREMLQKVVVATERATILTRSFCDCSRPPPTQSAAVDLNDLISNRALVIRQLIGESIELRHEATPDLPQIRADLSIVAQVLRELASNARVAMPQGGILTLATSVFHADEDYLRREPAARSGEFVVLTVTDTGCGIGSAPAGQVATSGNGSGLTKVRDWMQQQQGWLDVESCAGQGTRMRIFFPACREVARRPTPASGKAAPMGGRETLLVVADDREMRKLIQLMLKKLGYQVLEAASGNEALKAWGSRASDISLTLAEMVLPEGFNGYELIQRWQSEKPELKAIVLSDSAHKMPEAEIQSRSGVRFLPKPYDPESLARLIRSCLDETPGPPAGN